MNIMPQDLDTCLKECAAAVPKGYYTRPQCLSTDSDAQAEDAEIRAAHREQRMPHGKATDRRECSIKGCRNHVFGNRFVCKKGRCTKLVESK